MNKYKFVINKEQDTLTINVGDFVRGKDSLTFQMIEGEVLSIGTYGGAVVITLWVHDLKTSRTIIAPTSDPKSVYLSNVTLQPSIATYEIEFLSEFEPDSEEAHKIGRMITDVITDKVSEFMHNGIDNVEYQETQYLGIRER